MKIVARITKRLLILSSVLISINLNAQQKFAIENVSVITMLNEKLLENQTVLVEDGRVSRISPTSKTKLTPAIARIDGSGKFLIPGLFYRVSAIHSPMRQLKPSQITNTFLRNSSLRNGNIGRVT